MTIYVLAWQEYDDSEVVGLYSDPFLAAQAAQVNREQRVTYRRPKPYQLKWYTEHWSPGTLRASDGRDTGGNYYIEPKELITP